LRGSGGEGDRVDAIAVPDMRSISEVWERIRAHQNEHFETVRGLPFTYAVTGNELITDRSDFPLHASQFEKTLELLPLDRPGKINDLVHYT